MPASRAVDRRSPEPVGLSRIPWLRESSRPLGGDPLAAVPGPVVEPGLALGLVATRATGRPGGAAEAVAAWWRALGVRVRVERVAGPRDGAGLAAAIRRLEERGAAATLVAVREALCPGGAAPLGREMPVLAASGCSRLDADEGLARRPDVLAVAALQGGRRAPGTSLGPATELLAEARLDFGERRLEGALVAAARATLELGRALHAARRAGLAPGLAELRRLVLGLPGSGLVEPGFYRRHRAVELDSARLEARLIRPRGALLLRDLWVTPAVARPGARVLITVELESCGRAPASGRVLVGDAAGGEQVVSLSPLKPGRRRRLRVAGTAVADRGPGSGAGSCAAGRRDSVDLEAGDGAWIRDVDGRSLWILRGGAWIWPRLDGDAETWDRPVYAGGWVSPEAERIARLELASLREPRPDELEITVLNTGGGSISGWRLQLRSGGRIVGRRRGPLLRAGECCRVSLRLSRARVGPTRLKIEVGRRVGGLVTIDDALSLRRGPGGAGGPVPQRSRMPRGRLRDRDPADSSDHGERRARVPG